MNLILQLVIIFGICTVGELLNFILPTGILSLIIFTVLLFAGIIKEKHIDKVASFLTDHMILFFIPASISIVQYFDILAANLWKILLIITVSLFTTYISSSLVVMLVEKLRRR